MHWWLPSSHRWVMITRIRHRTSIDLFWYLLLWDVKSCRTKSAILMVKLTATTEIGQATITGGWVSSLLGSGHLVQVPRFCLSLGSSEPCRTALRFCPLGLPYTFDNVAWHVHRPSRLGDSSLLNSLVCQNSVGPKQSSPALLLWAWTLSTE